MGRDPVPVSHRREQRRKTRRANHQRATGWIRARVLLVWKKISIIPGDYDLRGHAFYASTLSFWLSWVLERTFWVFAQNVRSLHLKLNLILLLKQKGASYQSPIKMCNAHFNCDTVIGTRRIFAMLSLSSRKCNAGTALKTDWNEYFNRFSVLDGILVYHVPEQKKMRIKFWMINGTAGADLRALFCFWE